MSTENIDIVVKETGSPAAAKSISTVGTSAETAGAKVETFGGILEHLNSILLLTGIGLGVKEIFDYAESWAKTANVLRTVTDSHIELEAVQTALLEVSQKTHTSINDNAESFKHLTDALHTTNATMGDVVTIISNINSFMSASGKSSNEAASAIQALATGMERGTLSGRPLMELVRNSPELANALAASFDGTSNSISKTGVAMVRMGGATATSAQDLIRMADAGQITSQKILDMTTSIKFTTAANEALAKSHVTVRQAIVNFTNSLQAFIGKLDEASGAGDLVAHAILSMASNIPTVVTAIEGIIAVFITLKAQAALAFVALRLEMIQTAVAAEGMWAAISGGLSLLVPIIAAAVVYILNFGQSIKLTADGSISALGVLKTVVLSVYNAILLLWNFAGTAPGYWGQAALAILGFVAAAKVLLGVDIITWIVSATVRLGEMAVAATLAAGPWVILATAIIGAGLALAYHNGYLDTAITTLKEKLKPTIDQVVQSFKEMSYQPPIVAEKVDLMATAIAGDAQKVQGATKDWAKELADLAKQADATAASTTSDYAKMAAAASSAAAAATQYNTAASAPTRSTSNQQSGYGYNYGPAQNPFTSGHVDTGPYHFASGGEFDVGSHWSGGSGTDSQLVQFYASPNEKVTVTTPGQQQNQAAPGGGRPVHVSVSMQVAAKDADSFNLSRKTIVMGLTSEIQRATRSIG